MARICQDFVSLGAAGVTSVRRNQGLPHVRHRRLQLCSKKTQHCQSWPQYQDGGTSVITYSRMDKKWYVAVVRERNQQKNSVRKILIMPKSEKKEGEKTLQGLEDASGAGSVIPL